MFEFGEEDVAGQKVAGGQLWGQQSVIQHPQGGSGSLFPHQDVEGFLKRTHSFFHSSVSSTVSNFAHFFFSFFLLFLFFL